MNYEDMSKTEIICVIRNVTILRSINEFKGQSETQPSEEKEANETGSRDAAEIPQKDANETSKTGWQNITLANSDNLLF